ncbi:MAG TPA: hypothetical protein EYN54_14375 [Methylococcaceae bacterium]|nr:hypothetical protein [Methylococcaceae bacterium]
MEIYTAEQEDNTEKYVKIFNDAKPKKSPHLIDEFVEALAEVFPRDKKETKLKLTEDDIGKKFENKARAVFEVTGVGIFSASLKSKETGWESVWTCELDGAIHTGGMYKDNKLIKRHEPRYWLKDLPDADLFNVGIGGIYCNKAGWFASSGELSGSFITNRMPELTPNDYSLSKISMVELKEWQEANK